MMDRVLDLAGVWPLGGDPNIRWLSGQAQILRAKLIQLAVDHADWDADAVLSNLDSERTDPRVLLLTLDFLGKTLGQEWAAACHFAQQHGEALAAIVAPRHRGDPRT